MQEERSFSMRYLGALSIAAVVIIGAGLVVRQKLVEPEDPKMAPPSEAAALQAFSEENEMKAMSRYLAKRTRDVAKHVVRVAALDASGVTWGSNDKVVSTTVGRPVLIVPSASEDTLRPPIAYQSDSASSGWLIVVARDADDAVLSLSGLSGGRTNILCGTRSVRRFVLGVPLSADFAGAGVFDLTGRVRGMVIRCGTTGFAAIPAREVTRLMADTLPALPDSALADSSSAVRTGKNRRR